MRFGFFDQLPCAAGYSERQRYQDIMAQIELGDALGLDTAWLGELHFSRAFSTLADPLMVLAAAAQRARRIRLGTAVTLLPLHNPVKTAEQAATADLLSDGRLELGVGRGTAPIHYAGYDIPQEESRDALRGGARLHPGGVDPRDLLLRGEVLPRAGSHHRAPARAGSASTRPHRRQ